MELQSQSGGSKGVMVRQKEQGKGIAKQEDS